MYCRSFSKPVSGDGTGVGDAAGVVLLLDVLAGAPPPPQAPKNNTTIKSNTQPNSFIARFSKRVLYNLLIPDVHDRTFRIFVNNIKPAARLCMLKKIVMLIV